MFTGIIEEIGTVKAIQKGSKSIRLSIGAKKVLEDSKVGDSIAVNGVCLTVTSFGKDLFVADVMPESMNKTSMGELKIGDKVNLERALTLATRLGGHIVSGHIDGVGKIFKIEKDDNAVRVTISANSNIMKYIVAKGSVALDGVSLTVAEVTTEVFTVSLIPHTAEVTTLLNKKVGASINIENDIVGKYVERLILFSHRDELVNSAKNTSSSLSMNFLQENGF